MRLAMSNLMVIRMHEEILTLGERIGLEAEEQRGLQSFVRTASDQEVGQKLKELTETLNGQTR